MGLVILVVSVIATLKLRTLLSALGRAWEATSTVRELLDLLVILAEERLVMGIER